MIVRSLWFNSIRRRRGNVTSGIPAAFPGLSDTGRSLTAVISQPTFRNAIAHLNESEQAAILRHGGPALSALTEKEHQ
jgi:hypothetical protein